MEPALPFEVEMVPGSGPGPRFRRIDDALRFVRACPTGSVLGIRAADGALWPADRRGNVRGWQRNHNTTTRL